MARHMAKHSQPSISRCASIHVYSYKYASMHALGAKGLGLEYSEGLREGSGREEKAAIELLKERLTAETGTNPTA